jgi:hypothetical protein
MRCGKNAPKLLQNSVNQGNRILQYLHFNPALQFENVEAMLAFKSLVLQEN